jgi:hypothetical protein
MAAKTKQQQFTRAEAKQTGDKLGIDWEKFDVKEFLLGMNTECATGVYNPITKFATDDPIQIGKIVRAHLQESPTYYTCWMQREKAAALATAS